MNTSKEVISKVLKGLGATHGLLGGSYNESKCDEMVTGKHCIIKHMQEVLQR